ncbi:MAG: CBS domain-containing protein [Bdellovibrio sp.]|nr:MAG: CBS domain-containing protein [Bdellovibrio sp.]
MKTKVKAVMTKKLVTAKQGISLEAAYELMKTKRIRHLPVIDTKDDIVGVLSQRDLSEIPNANKIPVDYLMSTPVEYVEENTNLRSAIFKMLEKKISCLLIVDENDEAVGIVTTDDLLWYLAHLLRRETEDAPLLSAINMQTIGKVASELSDMGL